MSITRHNLVLGLAAGYSWKQLQPFIKSLKATGYEGEIALFCHGNGEETLRQLAEEGVTTVPFTNLRSRNFGKLGNRLVGILSAVYYRLKWPFYDRCWHELLSPAKVRYKLYRDFLKERGDQYNRVLLTDTRDVFFQRNPFENIPEVEAIFFQEDADYLIRNSRHNLGWLQAQFPPEVAERLKDRPILCSGTTMGTPAGLVKYLDAMLATMKTARRLNAKAGDQSFHIVTVYEKLDPKLSIQIQPNAAGPIYTLSRGTQAQDFKFSTNNELLYPDGRVAPVLHQYDRHPHLMAALLAKLELPSSAH